MASPHSLLSVSSICCKLVSASLLCLLLLEGVEAQNRSEEVSALLSFKYSNIDALPDHSQGYWITWKESDETACAWIGVTCTSNYTVSALDLSGWGFGEGGPPCCLGFLAALTDLRRLDLSSNNMDLVPGGISNLTGLTWLDLSWNTFDGLSSGLMGLNLTNCPRLRFLSIQNSVSNSNQDIIFEIPSLRGLVNLEVLLLANNGFSGPFPTVIGELKSLAILDLSNNSFNGSIPALPNLTNLVDLKLDNNRFTGFEESWFLSVNSTLEHLSVSFNQLEGCIPPSITNLLHLGVLDLSHNHLSGAIPFGLSQLSAATLILDLSANQLTGEIPGDIFQKARQPFPYKYLNLSNNLLSGNISGDGGVTYLRFLTIDLSYNRLSGSIRLDSTVFVHDVLWLQNNQFSGDVVDFLATGLQYPSDLRLQNNLFTGDLSRIVDISPIPNFLQVLDVSNNYLRWSRSDKMPDPITATLQKLMSGGVLMEFRAAGNNFSGTYLPTTCFLNESLDTQFEVLDLSNSHLQGYILDEAFDDLCLPLLKILNLSNNDLTGQVPERITMLSNLTVFDVSHNHLSGSMPAIPLNSSLMNPSFFEGNDGLCGYPLPPCPEVILKRGAGVPKWELMAIIMGSVFVAFGSCLVATWRWKVYQKRHQQDADLIKTLMERDSAALMSLRELKRATSNFAKATKIGEGGFGDVYRGKLNDGTIVAIKRSKREGSQKDKEQFLNEVRILSHVNHRNLVKLLGCCMESQIAVLVFEFVSNGTLQDHLHGKIGVRRLSWMERLNIAMQTAEALNYLHLATKFPIYHRDVKSANILLDEELNAKVADFGISKAAPIKATHVSTAGVGTLGYIDPDYWTSFQLNGKSDVYSFGVVLLELISAKHAIDLRRGEEERSLVFFAIPQIESADLRELIDPSLIKTYDDTSGRESILNVGRLAVRCVDMQSKARPSMKEVLNTLQNLWLELNGTSVHPDSMIEDDEEVAPCDHIVLSETFSCDSSNCTMRNGDIGIEMSQFTCSTSFNKDPG